MFLEINLVRVDLLDWIVGQTNLVKSSVLVVGAGGLGSPALLYLAACGVGKRSHSSKEVDNFHSE